MFVQVLIYTFINYLLFNSVYYLVSGILFMLDYWRFFQYNKIQKKDTIDTYSKCAPCVIKNSLLYSLLPGFLFGWYEATYVGTFSIIGMIIDLVLTLALAEIMFYFMHRLLHLPVLYSLIHKKHHQILAPIGFSALYMSPIDLYIGNLLPIFSPMYLLGMHPITMKIWLVVATVNTIVFSHSGFDGFANFHDAHHSCFNKNYGINLFMDRLLGTNV